MDSCQPTGIYTMGARGHDVRLLYARELVREPLWSPDGRSLAFALPFAGGSGLWVVGADGRGARLVKAINELSFSWAPNGRRFAIGGCKDVAHGDCAIYTVRADGTQLRRITRKLTRWEADNEIVPESPTWSPDGEWIAFTRYEDEATPEVYVVGSDGHDEHRVARGKQPAWSPDGRRLVFVVPSGRIYNDVVIPAGIGVASAGGGRPRLVADPPGAETDPTWLADGTRVVFAVGKRTYVGDPDRGGARVASRTPRRLRVTPTPNQRWARTGQHLRGRPGVVQIVTVRGVAATFTRSNDGSPDWAPDGRHLAFVRTTGGKKQIYVLDPQRKRARRLAAGDAPVWSPDGRWIAFEYHGGVFIVRPAGGRARLLTPGSDPSWSPNSQTVATGGGLFVVSAQGGKPRRIDVAVECDDGKFRPGIAATPGWSHDGRWIAFGVFGDHTESYDCSNLAAVTSDGTTQRLLLRNDLPPLLDATPQWTPDDSQIVFDLDGRLATIGADGNGLKSLDAWPTSGYGYARRSFALSPDGRLIAYTTSLADTEGRHDIWLIQTNGENPRPLLQSASAPAWQP